jgi:hypothetical protein
MVIGPTVKATADTKDTAKAMADTKDIPVAGMKGILAADMKVTVDRMADRTADPKVAAHPKVVAPKVADPKVADPKVVAPDPHIAGNQ